MKTSLSVTFALENGSYIGFARLIADLPFTPANGMLFMHPVWKSPKPAIGFVVSLTDSPSTVTLQAETVKPKEEFLELAEVYRSHGWTINE